MIDFSHLSPTEFEQFCYDCLDFLGLENLNWRKGTGLSTSSADQGRDIEGREYAKDFSGEKYINNWHIECKHYTIGVPFSAISEGLEMSFTKPVKTHLIIVSGFLTNPCKEAIENYKLNRKPPFRITYRENIDITKHVRGSAGALIERYNLVI